MKELFKLYNLHIGGNAGDFHILISMWGVNPIQITNPDPVIDKIQKEQHLKDVLRLKNWILDNSNSEERPWL